MSMAGISCIQSANRVIIAANCECPLSPFGDIVDVMQTTNLLIPYTFLFLFVDEA